jgi:NTE family protein
MGAVVGLGYATGARAAELETTARRLSSFRRLVGTVDLATTSDGLLAGRRLMGYLRPFLQGATTFDDLVLPARAVATDLRNGEQVAIDEGSLELAMRASIAMPPFVTPVLTEDRTLVDGGIINPIPVQVVRDMGADVVIAVNAVPPLDASSATVLTRVSRGLNRINPLAYLTGRLHSLNLLDLVMHSFQVVEHELGSYMAASADVFIRPDLGAHTWIEFYRAPEIIEHGASATLPAIEQIDDVLARRLEASVPAA